MRGSLAVLLALAISPVQASAKTEEPINLPATSLWAMNYAEDSCSLIRLFGEGEQEVRLEFRQFVPGGTIWALVSGKPTGEIDRGREYLRYRFDPDKKDIQTYTFRGELDDGNPSAMFPVSLDPYEEQMDARREAQLKRNIGTALRPEFDPEREAQIQELEIEMPDRPRIVLKLGSLAGPMKAMRTCLDDLLKQWGADPALQGSQGKGTGPVPTGNPNNWLDWQDYPKDMIREGVVDKVDFRLTIDEAGKPTECAVLTMESREEFINATCDALMRRGRFDPARDAEGNAAASVYVNSVSYTLY